MSITPEVSAKTLTQLVATEIRVQMARADVRQSQLSRDINKTEQWLSVRLRGRQPIDLNDLALIASALHVGVHELLPPPDVTARVLSGTNGRSARVVPPARRRSADRRGDGTNGHVGSPLGHGRRDSTRPVSAIPANRRRPTPIG